MSQSHVPSLSILRYHIPLPYIGLPVADKRIAVSSWTNLGI